MSTTCDGTTFTVAQTRESYYWCPYDGTLVSFSEPAANLPVSIHMGFTCFNCERPYGNVSEQGTVKSKAKIVWTVELPSETGEIALP